MMNATIFQPIAARPAPVNTEGAAAWVKANLLADWKTTLTTVIIGGLMLWWVPQILNWAIFKAVWQPNFDACRVEGAGACWGCLLYTSRCV